MVRVQVILIFFFFSIWLRYCKVVVVASLCDFALLMFEVVAAPLTLGDL
jgi:hypothetical protein